MIENIIKSVESANKIISGFKGKVSLNQFTTENLKTELEIDENKTILYRGRTIKKAYIYDLLHTFLIENLLKKRYTKIINASILKEKYNNEYNTILDYLVDNNHIYKKCGYTPGKSSTKYTLIKGDDFKLRRYINYDKVLIKKHNKRLVSIYTNNSKIDNKGNGSSIRSDIVQRMIESFSHLSIDYEKAFDYISSHDNYDMVKYEHLLFSIDCINNNDYRFGIDDYGRFHTNMTNLKSYIRDEYILLDGEKTGKIDITNSQPLFFLEILSNNIDQLDSYEYNKFKNHVIKGNIYEYFVKRYKKIHDRKDAKQLMYVVMFGKNSLKNIENRMFREEFPTIFEFIKKYKDDKGNYKMVSHEMQRAESKLIFNTIVDDIYSAYPDVVLFTVHDSIHIKKSDYEKVKIIFDKHINKYKDYLDNHFMLNLSPKAS